MDAPHHTERIEKIGIWGALVATICVLDMWALKTGRPTLSQGHGDAVSAPSGRIVLALIETILVCHLWRFPQRFARIDPIAALARFVAAK